eukprot:6686760-Ditylum_brightwellii.AAC.1
MEKLRVEQDEKHELCDAEDISVTPEQDEGKSIPKEVEARTKIGTESPTQNIEEIEDRNDN